MNYNKYIINKRKKQNYFLLILPLIIFVIIFLFINKISKGVIIQKISEVFKNQNITSIVKENTTNKEEDTTKLDTTSEAVAISADVSSNVSYYLVGFYEDDVNSSLEAIIESTPSIKINHDGKVFFLMKIMLKDEFNDNKALIDEKKYSVIQVDFSNSKTNEKLMNSLFLSMKEIFSKLTEENIKAIKTDDFKNWVLALPKEEENEEYCDKLVNIRSKIANLKDNMILEDCIGIIQTITN